jgi:large subunit ribosomal protein L18
MSLSKLDRRNRIRQRIRKIISGTAQKPRLSIFRSNKEIYAQIIDDVAGKTLVAASSRDKEIDAAAAATKIATAQEVGKLLASRAQKAGIENIIFDRGGYLYHGRVKALADGARESGLKF